MESSGAMITGWMKDSGKWYYADENGKMQTGMFEVNGKKYVANESGQLLHESELKDGSMEVWVIQ